METIKREHMNKIKCYSYVVKIVAKLNIATIYITYILFMNVFFFENVILMLNTSFELNVSLPDHFMMRLLFQHSLYTAFTVFCFFLISKTKARLYKKAGVLVALYITMSVVLSILIHFYVFSSINRFDIQDFMKRNVYMWGYIYILSWAYFHILKIHSKIKR